MRIDAYVTLGRRRETTLTADELLRELDGAEVDQAVIAPDDAQIAVDNREGNDLMLAEGRRNPDRLIPACTASPWYGDRAVAELTRAHGLGARMLVLDPTLQGFLINDTLAEPLLARAGELRMPVYVHTGPHLYGAPWQLVDAALRFPAVNFIMGHAGATDYWNDIPHAGAFAPNVSVEASFARPYKYDLHLRALGPGRGIMGSSAPRNKLGYEWSEYRRYFSAMENPEKWEPIFGANLRRLLDGVAA